LLALLISIFDCKLDIELLKKSRDLILLEVHDSVEDSENGVQDELVKSTFKWLALVSAFGGPLFGVGVEVVITL
jgi:hypothetical protein